MGEKSGAGRAVLNIAVETEKNFKEKKWYPFRSREFQPNLSVKQLTGKFYAKHDLIDESEKDPEIEEAIRRRQNSYPKDRSCVPETENQEYGWYLEPFLDLSRGDRRFHHPKFSSWVTKIGALIDRDNKMVPKKPFIGIPFKL